MCLVITRSHDFPQVCPGQTLNQNRVVVMEQALVKSQMLSHAIARISDFTATSRGREIFLVRTDVPVGGRSNAADRCWSLEATQVCCLENDTSKGPVCSHRRHWKREALRRERCGLGGGPGLAPTAAESVIVRWR